MRLLRQTVRASLLSHLDMYASSKGADLIRLMTTGTIGNPVDMAAKPKCRSAHISRLLCSQEAWSSIDARNHCDT